MTLFNPILDGREAGNYGSLSTELLFITAYSLLFQFPKKPFHELDDVLDELKNQKVRLIDNFIEISSIIFKRIRVFLAISNIAILFEFGALTMEGSCRLALRRMFNLPGD